MSIAIIPHFQDIPPEPSSTPAVDRPGRHRIPRAMREGRYTGIVAIQKGKMYTGNQVTNKDLALVVMVHYFVTALSRNERKENGWLGDAIISQLNCLASDRTPTRPNPGLSARDSAHPISPEIGPYPRLPGAPVPAAQRS